MPTLSKRTVSAGVPIALCLAPFATRLTQVYRPEVDVTDYRVQVEVGLQHAL